MDCAAERIGLRQAGRREGVNNTASGACPAAHGRRSGEGSDPGEQLALGESAALLDVDASLAAVAVVIGTDLFGEVLDHLAVTDQQQVVVDRHHPGDVGEEGWHVLIAMALAGGVPLGGGAVRSSGAGRGPWSRCGGAR